MELIWIAFFSIALSLLIGFTVNKVLNNSFGFLRDDEPFLNRYNIFQIMVPSFLLTFSLTSIFFNFNSAIPRIVQVTMILYLGVILSWYNNIRSKKRKLSKIKLNIIDSIIDPWKRKFLAGDLKYSLNLYWSNKRISGEVTFNVSISHLKPDAVEEIKTHLKKYNIRVHFRENKSPALYKFTN